MFCVVFLAEDFRSQQKLPQPLASHSVPFEAPIYVSGTGWLAQWEEKEGKAFHSQAGFRISGLGMFKVRV